MLLQALTQLTVTVSTIQEGGGKNKPWEVSLASEEADGSVFQWRASTISAPSTEEENSWWALQNLHSLHTATIAFWEFLTCKGLG